MSFFILILTFAKSPVGLVDITTGNIIYVHSAKITNDGMIFINEVYRSVVAMGGEQIDGPLFLYLRAFQISFSLHLTSSEFQKMCLASSRISGFSMYPMLVTVFITKMKALQTFFAKTPLSMYLGILKSSHDAHVYAGQ